MCERGGCRSCRWLGPAILACASFLAGQWAYADAASVPRNVEELWSDFAPRRDPLEVELVKEWRADGNVYRVILYTVGTFKGARARMAAYYGFPRSNLKVPGLLHMHGGGQRAFLHLVEYYVSRGYACISVNWGGRPLDDKNPDWPNTDWGKVDPTQKNVPGYNSLRPTPRSLEPFRSPRNNNWYMLTLGCRRALTFLERQPEVDPDRLGVFGHSMGGNLSFYVAGTDSRVKAAVPSVGGVGFRTYDVPGIPGTGRRIDGDDETTELYRKTIASEAYARHVECPVLFLGATNDFNSRMDSVHRCYGLIARKDYRLTFAPHLNHRFLPEQEVCRPLWLDAHLKKTFAFPETPRSRLVLDRGDGVPVLEVTPDRSMEIARVDIYYSVDPDALARFWRDAGARKKGGSWVGRCPVMDLDRPLFAFANVYYRLDRPETLTRRRLVDQFCLSSGLRSATPEMLRKAGPRATDRPEALIDDFERGYHDWYVLEKRNPHHWQFWTRKITDPKWRGPPGARLRLEVKSLRGNKLVVLLVENEWRGYRGRRKTYASVVSLKGSPDWQEALLEAGDFTNDRDGAPLSGWGEIDQLGIRPRADAWKNGKKVRNALGGTWAGPVPQFRSLRWVVE